jgi:2,3-dihydroxybenzoate-AMP ligase
VPGNNAAVTAEYIVFHAIERPDAVAIVNNGRDITYAEFARDIRKVTHALRALDLPRGSKAAIDVDDAYFNWLLRLAFEQLRVITATVELPDKPGGLSHVRDFNIVLTGKSFPAGTAPRLHPTTTELLDGVLASGQEDHEPTPEKRLDDPIRIVQTSGTTGTSKKLLFTRQRHESLIDYTIWFAGLTRKSRYLLALPLTVGGPAACVRAGGTVVMEERMPVWRALATQAITHTTLPPFTLKRVIDELPADFAKPAELVILSFGAGISRALRERALARLATDVCDMYSSNEAGWTSSVSGTAEIGTVWPGVRVEVVDEHDRPLPFGEAGQIRVQTANMTDGYIDDPETTSRIFRDGWFYPSDIGILHDARRLQVIGRSDDVLNIGWRKIAPEVIEDLVLKSADAADVGVCAILNADGIEEIGIAVSSPRHSDEELLRRITAAFRGFQFGRFHVVKVAGIPRTERGKVRRKVLKEIVAEAIRQNTAR